MNQEELVTEILRIISEGDLNACSSQKEKQVAVVFGGDILDYWFNKPVVNHINSRTYFKSNNRKTGEFSNVHNYTKWLLFKHWILPICSREGCCRGIFVLFMFMFRFCAPCILMQRRMNFQNWFKVYVSNSMIWRIMKLPRFWIFSCNSLILKVNDPLPNLRTFFIPFSVVNKWPLFSTFFPNYYLFAPLLPILLIPILREGVCLCWISAYPSSFSLRVESHHSTHHRSFMGWGLAVSHPFFVSRKSNSVLKRRNAT